MPVRNSWTVQENVFKSLIQRWGNTVYYTETTSSRLARHKVRQPVLIPNVLLKNLFEIPLQFQRINNFSNEDSPGNSVLVISRNFFTAECSLNCVLFFYAKKFKFFFPDF
jgi:hypothetical protein